MRTLSRGKIFGTIFKTEIKYEKMALTALNAKREIQRKKEDRAVCTSKDHSKKYSKQIELL